MNIEILQGDALERLRELPDESVHCCVTSPPYYGLRNYGVDGQIGLEKTPQEYIAKMVEIFAEVKRVLRKDGTCWVNMGDSYASNTKGSGGPSEKQLSNAGSRYEMNQRLNHGLKEKDLMGMPWRLAFALQDGGWYLRSDIIWHKSNPMPESIRDRPTKSHEYIFLLTKSGKYYYDADAISEPAEWARWGDQTVIKEQQGTASWIANKGKNELTDDRRKNGFNGRWDQAERDGDAPLFRNARDVWTIATQGYLGAHFATFPDELPRRCISAGCREGDTVLDPFLGSGTTLAVAKRLGRNGIGIELNPEYAELARQRIANETPSLFGAVR